MLQLLNWFDEQSRIRRTEFALNQRLQTVRRLESKFRSFSTDQLRSKYLQLQTAIDVDASDRIKNSNLAAAMGALAVERVMGFRLHDVQIKGALATSDGSIIQMNTGEGKTVVCGLAAIIRAIFDSSVHVATTNAYLAERDYLEVRPILELLGIKSSFIDSGANESQARTGYLANIVYAPGYVFGFDYLKDQLQLREFESTTLGLDVLQKIAGTNVYDQLRQTGHQTIIVDEADSVLIDESTTPLLLSGSPMEFNESASTAYELAQILSEQLSNTTDFLIVEERKSIELTEIGIKKIFQVYQQHQRLELIQPWTQYVSNALYAQQFLRRDEHYVVVEDKIKLVDQNTGRIFDDRTLRAGLQQALQAKEKLGITPPNLTAARITRQKFFQLYNTVCGLTGTISGSENEIRYFYDSDVVVIPTHQPCKRIELPDLFFRDWESKAQAIATDVHSRQSNGQPVLIGTRTIRESQLLANVFEQISIEFQLLNGLQDSTEAELVRLAGMPNKVTIATNMAGRGTDIRLSSESRSVGGLHVIGTQRFESRRVDRQLAGRSARQGDPGSCQFFVSADDALLTEHSPEIARQIDRSCDSNGVCRRDFSKHIEILQTKVEFKHFSKRKKLVQTERWFDQVRETVAG